MVQSGVVVQHRNLVGVLAEETRKKEYKGHFTLYGKEDIRDGVRHYQRFPGGDNWIHLQDVVHGGHPILGLQAFQDSTLVSSNGVSAKPCRISVLNVDLEGRCTTRPSIQRVCSCRMRRLEHLGDPQDVNNVPLNGGMLSPCTTACASPFV